MFSSLGDRISLLVTGMFLADNSLFWAVWIAANSLGAFS
jgi:hypothetical protein